MAPIGGDDQPSNTLAEVGEFPSVAAFGVNLTVVSPADYRGMFKVRAVATGILSASDARLVLVTPDAPGGVSESGDVLPRAAGAGPAHAGATAVVNAELSFSEPGYYRVTAVAQADVTETFHNGRYVQGHVGRDVWIWANEADAFVTEDFDAKLFGDSLVAAPGPFRRVPQRTGTELGPDAASAEGVQFSLSGGASAGCVGGWVKYYNQNTSTVVPVNNAIVEGEIQDIYGGTRNRSRSTDANGYWELCGNYGDSDFQGYVVLRSAANLPGTYQNVYASFPYSTTTSTQQNQLANNQAAHVFASIEAGRTTSYQVFSRMRSTVDVRLDATASNSFYSPSTDRITIKSGSSGHVWGNFGTFVIAHEYGHAFHEDELGGNAAGGNCPSPHFLDVASNIKCAYSEGFANFFSVAIVNSGSFVTNIQNNVYYPGGDGSLIEGPFASTLLDLLDPAGDESHDQLSVPGSWIAKIVETCWTNSGRANGTDHIVYCMENGVDPAIANSSTYFPSRSAPSSVSHSAGLPSGWTKSKVRDIWTENLYGI